MPSIDDPETLRQYARCYIMLLIGGYLLTDKSNNLVHIRWLSLFRDFAERRALSWGSAVLAWTYRGTAGGHGHGDMNWRWCEWSVVLHIGRVYETPTTTVSHLWEKLHYLLHHDPPIDVEHQSHMLVS
ncbi:hypothetical protein Ahy_Scaffold6g108029 [Arachis hypogaea]|uniref:Aminotransferase-like plant mobile domain-containing protein n=1 Tax=Arachis hypogaea TaxID=3818 RepID=A0A444WP62_ARAHY|nr:hypothetical protein Ahy_Scaffold6g108029 [Arachis hypogaea]